MASSFNAVFQPIVDTAGHRIFAHHCGWSPVGEAEAGRAPELIPAQIRAAAGRWTNGLYFIDAGVRDPCFRSIMAAVRESDLQPANIVFEVAESSFDPDSGPPRQLCEQYRRHGFGLALADAGIGPNSLTILQDLRPDFIKLDKVLVRDIERPKNAAYIQRLSGLADQLGVQVVANGVERHRNVENLWLLGIQIMQGSLFGRPASSIVHSITADLANLAQALESSDAFQCVPVRSSA